LGRRRLLGGGPGGFLAGAGLGGLAGPRLGGGALGLLAGGELGGDLLAPLALVLGQIVRIAGRRRRFARRRGPAADVEGGTLLGGGGRGEVGRRRRADATVLGLDHYGLGATVAEALLHRAGADRAGARLQRQGGPSRPVFILVRHALA